MHAATLFDGALSLSGMLYGADAAMVESALRVFDVPDAVGDDGRPVTAERTLASRTADALVAMAQCALAHRRGPGDSGRFVPHVTMVVDVAELRASALRGAGVSTLGQLDRMADERGWSSVERAWFTDAMARHGSGITAEGLPLDAAAIGALSCESVVNRVLTVGTEILEMGREVRTATRQQRKAIIARDRHCRAPGCRTKPRHCDVHHVDHWMLGGETDVGRLVLLCGTHHRQFHRNGWRLELADDGRLTVTSPKGWTRSTMPQRDEQLVFARSVQP